MRKLYGHSHEPPARPTQSRTRYANTSADQNQQAILLVRGVIKDRQGKFDARRLAHRLLVHTVIKVCRHRL